jgi:hypothetical protein
MGGTMFFALLSTLFSFAPPAGPSANGQGNLSLPGEISRRFAFHANTMPDGSVKGSGVLTYTGGEIKIMFDIDCLSITGSTATMSGTVTKLDGSTPSAFVPGSKVWFKVVDNGEGAKAAEDQMSLLFLVGGGCTTPYVVPIAPIEGGNIQVKP